MNDASMNMMHCEVQTINWYLNIRCVKDKQRKERLAEKGITETKKVMRSK